MTRPNPCSPGLISVGLRTFQNSGPPGARPASQSNQPEARIRSTSTPGRKIQGCCLRVHEKCRPTSCSLNRASAHKPPTRAFDTSLWRVLAGGDRQPNFKVLRDPTAGQAFEKNHHQRAWHTIRGTWLCETVWHPRVRCFLRFDQIRRSAGVNRGRVSQAQRCKSDHPGSPTTLPNNLRFGVGNRFEGGRITRA